MPEHLFSGTDITQNICQMAKTKKIPMKKVLVIAAFALGINATAQNFEAPERTKEADAIETLIKKRGQPTRHYLSDPKNKIFDAQPGETYVVAFVFDATDTKRRTLVYQMGEKGEKLKNHYPQNNMGYKNAGRHAFGVVIEVPEDVKAPVRYKVDGSPTSTVYIYKYTRGVAASQ